MFYASIAPLLYNRAINGEDALVEKRVLQGGHATPAIGKFAAEGVRPAGILRTGSSTLQVVLITAYGQLNLASLTAFGHNRIMQSPVTDQE